MGIQITGLEQVQRRLKEAPKLLAVHAFAQALDRAAGVVAAAVEEATPEGETGLLKESVITAVAVDIHGRGGIAAIGFGSTKSEQGVPQDTIAYWIEYGHRIVTHRPGLKAVGNVPMNPFMRGAFEASADRAIEVFGEVFIENLSVIEEGK